MISKQRLIDTLNEVRQQAVSGSLTDYKCGICYNWFVILSSDFTYKLVSKLSATWEHKKEDSIVNPVPHQKGFGLWEGINLKMRLSLIDHILVRLAEVSQECLDEWYYN